MASFNDIIMLLARFIATVLGMALNMKRIMSTPDVVDDIIFIISIIIGLFFGIYWESIINKFLRA